jgi:hypothetical protein
MYDYKVILVGCTKNSGSYIYEHLTRLNQMAIFFTKFNIVIYENDSTDNTVEQLNLFKSNNSNFNFISETNVVEKYIQNKHINLRVQIIAHGRNCLLHIVNSLYTNYDYMLMIDLDTVLNNFDPNNIHKIFSYDVNLWDVLTANCNGPYYDIWALRITQNIWQNDIHGKIWNNPIIHDCWAQQVMNMSFKDCVKSYQKVIPMNSSLIKTDSSFGGAGIYRINKIKDCYYNPFCYNHRNMLSGQCEHVSFHQDINKNGGRIFICPSFIVNCPIEHIQK